MTPLSRTPRPDIKFNYYIKKKTEYLIKFLLKFYHLEIYQSSNLRFRLNYDDLMNTPLYSNFLNKIDKDGKPYIYGLDFIPSSFTEYIKCNYSYLYDCICIYERILQKNVTRNDLQQLNEIYKKFYNYIQNNEN